MSVGRWPKAIVLILAAGLLVAACGGSNNSGGTKTYKVGISNTLTGNGFREEMICSIKAQAKASGIVSKVITSNRNTDPSGQIADVRNLISAGVNVIVMNPSDRSALDAVIKEATDKGIVVVTVDQGVTSTGAYQLYNNQVKYAQLGADWLFKQIGSKGNVVEMRGINGVSADADRHQGFQATLANYPNIKVIKETFTNWSLDPAAQQTKDIISSGLAVNGIWTSGIDSTVVDQMDSSASSSTSRPRVSPAPPSPTRRPSEARDSPSAWTFSRASHTRTSSTSTPRSGTTRAAPA